MAADEQEELQHLVERKHTIKRYRRRFGDYWFWDCEIYKPHGAKPHATVRRRTDLSTIQDATREAKRLINVMIRHGGAIPPDELGADVTFDVNTLDGLNARSSSGKRQWCEAHWAAVKAGQLAGTHNAIVAGVLLTTQFIDRIKADGVLTTPTGGQYAIEMLRDSYSPFCCWLGQETVDRIMEASSVEALKILNPLADLERLMREQQEKKREKS